jgi:hypothetical protein
LGKREGYLTGWFREGDESKFLNQLNASALDFSIIISCSFPVSATRRITKSNDTIGYQRITDQFLMIPGDSQQSAGLDETPELKWKIARIAPNVKCHSSVKTNVDGITPKE